jgi:hypothetical protein
MAHTVNSTLEAFGLAEEVGAAALTVDEVLFMADARKRKGCKLMASKLTDEEIRQVIELGRKCLAYKEGR